MTSNNLARLTKYGVQGSSGLPVHYCTAVLLVFFIILTCSTLRRYIFDFVSFSDVYRSVPNLINRLTFRCLRFFNASLRETLILIYQKIGRLIS